DHAVGAPIPQTDAAALPADLWILENGGELPQLLALDRWSAAAIALWRRKGEQVGVKPQSGDDAYVLTHCAEEFDCCKSAIGDQDDIALGKPAADLWGGLSCPIDECLWCPQLGCIEVFGGCQQSEEWQRHDAVGPRYRHQ